jgi:hypothetical protein
MYMWRYNPAFQRLSLSPSNLTLHSHLFHTRPSAVTISINLAATELPVQLKKQAKELTYLPQNLHIIWTLKM